MLTIRRRDPERRMARFYSIRLQGLLGGGFAVLREWGRIGSAGQVRGVVLPSEAHALAEAEALAERKRRRGYG